MTPLILPADVAIKKVVRTRVDLQSKCSGDIEEW
jgi:hypothetical protein